MENLARPEVKVTIAGKDVTRDLTPFIVSMQYHDSVEASSDSVDIYLTAEDDRFANDWYPPKGSKLEVSMGYKGDMVSAGTFDIDEVEYEVLPYRVTIRGVAALVTKGVRTKRTVNYEDNTLVEIVGEIARRHGLRSLGNIDPRLVLPRVAQVRETDIAFLSRLADLYGYNFSMRNDLLFFSDVYDLEGGDPVVTVDMKDVERANFRDETMKVKRAATTRYVNPDTQTSGIDRSTPPIQQFRQYVPTPYSPLYRPFENRFELTEVSRVPAGDIDSGAFPSDDETTLGAPYAPDADFAFRRLDNEVAQPAPTGPGGAVNGVPFPGDGVTGKHPPYNAASRFVFHRPPEVNGTDADEENTYGGARSGAEAFAMSRASIYKSRTAQITGTINMPGRPTMLSGSSILLTGFGDKFDGKYFITASSHDVGSIGYATQVSLKKV